MANQPTEKTVIRGELRVYDDDGFGFTHFEAAVGGEITLTLDEVQRAKIAEGNRIAVEVTEVATKAAGVDS